MERWEYATLTVDNTQTGLRFKTYSIARGEHWTSLTELGKDGWELCAILEMRDENLPCAIFKRPASEDRHDY